MEASLEQTPLPSQALPPEPTGPTAKQLAAVEEQNQLRALKLIEQQNQPPAPPPVDIREVAARGYDALQEQFKRHAEASKKKEYVPPPRTARQMEALQEELEAGRRVSERAAAQAAAAKPPKVDASKEGFINPVYRPNDVVPDPISGGMKGFSADV